jgi:hypothetical protein
MNWLNGNPLLNVGITLVVLVGGGFLAWRGVRSLGDIKRAETLVRGQFVAVDERDVLAMRNKFERRRTASCSTSCWPMCARRRAA